MSCAVCPITVKKALTQLDGVQDVKTDLPGLRSCQAGNHAHRRLPMDL